MPTELWSVIIGLAGGAVGWFFARFWHSIGSLWEHINKELPKEYVRKEVFDPAQQVLLAAIADLKMEVQRQGEALGRHVENSVQMRIAELQQINRDALAPQGRDLLRDERRRSTDQGRRSTDVPNP